MLSQEPAAAPVQPGPASSSDGSPAEYSHPTHCPSCNRRFAYDERRSRYNGVEVCAGCAALQITNDAVEVLGMVLTAFEKLQPILTTYEKLQSTVSGLSARERI